MSTVIILGAGASKPAGIPLGRDFLQQALKDATFGKWKELESLDKLLQLEGADDLYYKINPSSSDFSMQTVIIPTVVINSHYFATVDIEEILKKAQDHAATGKLPPNDLEGIKRLIFKTISYRAGLARGKLGVYEKLIKQTILPANGTPCTVLSFNYDILLEKSLLGTGNAGSYSYKIPNVDTENFPSYEKKYDARFDILKLHGSLNWFRCPSCLKFLIRWESPYRDDLEGGYCGPCDISRERVLVPPGHGKEKYVAPLQPVWAAAAEKLSNADEVIVIGYSFRPSDTAACALISDNLATRNDFELTVVDRSPDDVLRRLSELGVGPGVIAGTVRSSSFEEYTGSGAGHEND